jgi:hypothetical protein
MKYRPKPIEIEAVQYKGYNNQELKDFVDSTGWDVDFYSGHRGALLSPTATWPEAPRFEMWDYIVKHTHQKALDFQIVPELDFLMIYEKAE